MNEEEKELWETLKNHKRIQENLNSIERRVRTVGLIQDIQRIQQESDQDTIPSNWPADFPMEEFKKTVKEIGILYSQSIK